MGCWIVSGLVLRMDFGCEFMSVATRGRVREVGAKCGDVFCRSSISQGESLEILRMESDHVQVISWNCRIERPNNACISEEGTVVGVGR
jgi:hypothetical protein